MNIVPRDPWFNMDNFFDDLFLHNNQAEQEGFFKPRVDIFDKGDHYLFIAELPGVAKKDINVSTRNGVLTIEAKVSEEHSAEKDQTIRKEEVLISGKISMPMQSKLNSPMACSN